MRVLDTGLPNNGVDYVNHPHMQKSEGTKSVGIHDKSKIYKTTRMEVTPINCVKEIVILATSCSVIPIYV